MPDFGLRTAVVLIIFNRPDTTARVFAEIAKAKPLRLLVIGDGPRGDRQGEMEQVAKAREIVRRVDWPCTVQTNFSDVNLGCKKRVSSGIDWVFSQVDEAIILEDDCLPEPSFFRFCEEMLERYRADLRVGMISGDNFHTDPMPGADSYYFSKYCHIWGWASWKDRWVESYDVGMAQWPRVRDTGQLLDMLGGSGRTSYWDKIFSRVHQGKVDTWDYQWVFANWLQGRLSVMPTVNLVSNIGFRPDATHTNSLTELADLPTMPMAFPLQHPVGLLRNTRADRVSAKRCFQPLWRRIYGRVKGWPRILSQKIKSVLA